MSVVAEQAVSNFIWRQERMSSTLPLDDFEQALGILGDSAGQFALHGTPPSGPTLLARDRLGVNKLFWAIAADGTVESSNYWIDLARRGHAPDAIWSVPSGHLVEVDPQRERLRARRYADLEFNERDPADPQDLERWAAPIRRRLATVFRRIRAVAAGRQTYVTLSGGMDSSTVAALAREHLGEFTAVTFAVDAGGETAEHSDDLACARRLATEFGVSFAEVVVPPDEIVALLDEVLLYGQDWREFNVHCGLVNAALARAIAGRHAGGKRSTCPLLLTGDTMNELTADYAPESYAGREYYGLPRLPPHRLRRFLVAGLDSGDREIGIFRHWNVDALQPFAMCAGEIAEVPPAVLAEPGGKQRLMRAVMGDRVPEFVYARPKTRAQVGNERGVGGTLALLADRGIDAAALERRFCELYGVDARWLRGFIRGGFYRSTTTYPGRSA